MAGSILVMYYYHTICKKQYEDFDGGPRRPYEDKVVRLQVL